MDSTITDFAKVLLNFMNLVINQSSNSTHFQIVFFPYPKIRTIPGPPVIGRVIQFLTHAP